MHAVLDPNGEPKIKIFSRHLEDMTDKYPDVAQLVKQYCRSCEPEGSIGVSSDFGVTSFILDAEIVAWDEKSEATKSFQELSNRPRKDVKLHDVKIPVCLFVFDLMYLDGEVSAFLLSWQSNDLRTNGHAIKSLLSSPFRERRRLLHEKFRPRVMSLAQGGARLDHVKSLDSDCSGGRDEIESFWEVAVDSQCEGLMVKVSRPDVLDQDQS